MQVLNEAKIEVNRRKQMARDNEGQSLPAQSDADNPPSPPQPAQQEQQPQVDEDQLLTDEQVKDQDEGGITLSHSRPLLI